MAAIVSIPVSLAASMDAEAASPKLGNLAKFRTIATDASALLEKGDIAAAKLRLKDLETSWDEAEAGLKPRAAAAWHEVDKAIDRMLTAIRSTSPNLEACKAAIKDLIAVMDQVGGST
jgi:hypothetical protein